MTAYLMPVEQGRRIVLDKAVVFIGRHPDCDVLLTHSRKISRKHCCIAQVNDFYIVRDLGSMNGVHVNGARVEREVRLNIGDQVMIGDCQYVLNSSGEKKPDDKGKNVKNGSKNGSSTKRQKQTPLPPNLSQDIPILVNELDENFAGDPPTPVTPNAIPVAEMSEEEDEADEVINFDDDDGEAADSSSYELLPE